MKEYYNEILKILEFELQIQENLLTESLRFPSRYPKVISLCKTEIIKLEELIKNTIKITNQNDISLLWNFIEDRTKCKISVNFGEVGYQISLDKFDLGDQGEYNEIEFFKEFNELGNDLLKALQQVAIKIAEVEYSNE